MARGTYDDTQQRILNSGLKMFLEKGFERANLREGRDHDRLLLPPL